MTNSYRTTSDESCRASERQRRSPCNPILHIDPDGNISPSDIINPFERVAPPSTEEIRLPALSESYHETIEAKKPEMVTTPHLQPDLISALELITSVLQTEPKKISKNDTPPTVKTLESEFISTYALHIVHGTIYGYDGRRYVKKNDDALLTAIQTFVTQRVGDAVGPKMVRDIASLVMHDELVINDDLKPSTEYISFQNGLLSLCDNRLYSHTPRIFCVNYVDVCYYPQISSLDHCPYFCGLLNTAAGGEATLIKRLLQIFTTCLTPLKPKKIFWFFGVSNSGKSVILNVLQRLLKGDTCAFTLEMLDGDFGLEPADGKNLLICDDASNRKFSPRAAALLKSLVSPDGNLPCNKKGKAIAEMEKSRLKVVIASNYVPDTAVYDDGINTRIELFTMPYSVPRSEQIPELCDIIIRNEASSIISYCLNIVLPELIATNFALCGERETEILVENINTILSPDKAISEFLSEFIDPDYPNRFYTTEELHTAFLAFSEGKTRLLSQNSFSREMKKMFGENDRKWDDIKDVDGSIKRSRLRGYYISTIHNLRQPK